MVRPGVEVCPLCNRGCLIYYDTVKRVLRSKNRKTGKRYIRRMRCSHCKTIHRELPFDIFPYKQYEAEIIRGVCEGLITSCVLGFEDYPCEKTMELWKRKINIAAYEEVDVLCSLNRKRKW